MNENLNLAEILKDCPKGTRGLVMTQEDKELLTRDLSCRIPYGVIVNVNGLFDSKLTSVSWYSEVSVDDSVGLYPISEVKPYLFPLSSMTEEQEKELKYLCDWENDRWNGLVVIQEGKFCMNTEIIDWLNENHFDYNGLIKQNLAIDATGLNIY